MFEVFIRCPKTKEEHVFGPFSKGSARRFLDAMQDTFYFLRPEDSKAWSDELRKRGAL